MWSQQNSTASSGFFPTWLRVTVGPLFLILVTLPFASVLVSASKNGGSLSNFLAQLSVSPLVVLSACLEAPTWLTIRVLCVFVAWQLALMKIIPGKSYLGPTTSTGHVPEYTENGPTSFLLTLVAYFGLSTWFLGAHLPSFLHYSPAILFDEYARMITLLSFAALLFCMALTVKGRTCPSGRDSGSSGNLLQDLYWGTELYPRILTWDVKQFTNCRFGMMMWGLLPLAFAARGMESSGNSLPTRAEFVNTLLQLIYVSKFFLWESGYMRSLDIMHDRAGYMICWGCMVWFVINLRGASRMLTVKLLTLKKKSPFFPHPLFSVSGFPLCTCRTPTFLRCWVRRLEKKVRSSRISPRRLNPCFSF